ncbi:ATP-binding cassette domain-containing protein [Corynebacterium poyangense]|uniref:ATP-binding cassette domain-containing protein n=1 Tax=Corynebacterium poyangense TaxID=2684405 RepID=A0A7H0SMY1_9CORY|nr:ABC-F family ATP-binding cassette domain-containing protein [Corynebacterium poyangense]MBZ8176262.1 ATP-binding cassette domain-containing protein [Corynebacterium poyangense]QNQ89906.1 ATP-binding cassette domain-containing protein [Corynebacterium poyangense]
MATPLLGAETIRVEYPTRVVFDSVSVAVEEGDRIGVVGRNGDGKTTLLGVLAGTVDYQAGRVTQRKDLRFGVLSQRDNFPDDMPVSTAIVGQREEYEWASDPKIRDIISGLVADISWDKKIGELSGGQRRRVALAALLIEEWDLIALDEPTNHLDVEGIAWLADHLKKRWAQGQGGLVVITHDRWFLDEVCTETWEVHDGVVEPFEGGYAAYVLQRVERDRIAAQAEQKRQNLLRKELAWLRRGAPARTSKPKFRIEAANRLIEDVPPVRNTLQLQRLAVERLGKKVVDLENVTVRYGQREILKNITWRIAPGERTAILGANGAGKSTLLGLICGAITPDEGHVKHGKTVKIGILDQQFSQLSAIGDDRVREVLGRTKTTFNVGGKELTPAQLLERLGFLREHLSARVNDLSGGQKRRLQLLMLLLSEPNVLALDEPTNDVDADMLAALEDLLDSWPGTLLVVSHDRYLVERVTDQQYAIFDGTLRHVPGGVDEYLRLAKQKRDDADGEERKSPQPSHRTQLSGAQRRTVEKEMTSLERRLDKLGEAVARIHQDMAAHDPSDYQGLQEKMEEIRRLENEAAELEERWLELSEIVS